MTDARGCHLIPPGASAAGKPIWTVSFSMTTLSHVSLEGSILTTRVSHGTKSSLRIDFVVAAHMQFLKLLFWSFFFEVYQVHCLVIGATKEVLLCVGFIRVFEFFRCVAVCRIYKGI